MISVPFTYREWETLKMFELRVGQNLQGAQKHVMQSEKIAVCCAIHSEVLQDQYYLNNETLKEESYCELFHLHEKRTAKIS